MPIWRKKFRLLIIALFIALLLLRIGIYYFDNSFRQSKHDVIVSSYPQGKEIYIDEDKDSVSRTPTRLKLNEAAKIEVEDFGKHDVEKVLRDGIIFFTDSPLSIEKRFESYQYRQIIEDEESGDISLKKHQKRYVAYSYFWLGNLLEAKAILDELKESLSGSEQAEVFMYLGYSNLSLGDESEARKYFTKAFKHNLYLEHDQGAFRNKELGQRIITEAKIDARMKVQLDLFVVVDVSESALKGQEARVVKFQNGVVAKLNGIGQAFFYPFGDTLPAPEFPNYSSSPNSIIQVHGLRNFAEWTNFSELFDKLPQIIENHKQNQESSERQSAILIISDGEHSVDGDKGGGEARIPLKVARKLKVFSEHHKDIPIVMVTIDQGTQTDTVTNGSEAKGLDYTNEWREELKRHPVGQSLYYSSQSTLDDILASIFNVIAPYRDKVLITRASALKKEIDSTSNQEWYTVQVQIQSTLPEVTLRVESSIPEKNDADNFMIRTEWEELKRERKDKDKSILIIRRQRRDFSINKTEKVRIKGSEIRDAFKSISSSSSAWKPQIFTLNFYRGEDKVGTISLPFPEDKPRIQISRLFGETVVLKAGNKNDLRFKAKSIPPIHHLEQPISIKIRVDGDQKKTFEEKIGDFKPSIKTEIISKDLIRRPGQHEFNLSIKAFPVDHLLHKKTCDDIEISVEPYDNNPGYTIDDSELGKMDFRVVHESVYFLYECVHFIWVPFLAIVLLILHPSVKSGKTTSSNSSGPDEKLGFLSEQFKRLKKSNGKTTSSNSSGPDEKPGFLSKEFKLLETWKGRKWAFGVVLVLALPLVGLSLWICWSSLMFWVFISISLIPFGISRKKLEPFFIIFSAISLICAVAWVWGYISVVNWGLISTSILSILCIVLIGRQYARDNRFDRSDIPKSIFLGAEFWIAIHFIQLGELWIGIFRLISATARLFF